MENIFLLEFLRIMIHEIVIKYDTLNCAEEENGALNLFYGVKMF